MKRRELITIERERLVALLEEWRDRAASMARLRDEEQACCDVEQSKHPGRGVYRGSVRYFDALSTATAQCERDLATLFELPPPAAATGGNETTTTETST